MNPDHTAREELTMVHEASKTAGAGHGAFMSNNGQIDLEALANEPLLPELLPYLRSSEVLGTGIHHPLVIEPMGVLTGLANRIYTSKKEALKKAINQQEWETVVFIHERPYRVEAFVQHVLGGIATPLADLSPELKELATVIWSDSENHFEMARYWAELFSKRDGTLLLADERGKELYDTLSNEVTVYRGDHQDSLRLSWSLNKTTAEFFAKRYNEHGRSLLTGTVKKEHIFGVVANRNEAEILVEMRNINITDKR